MMKSAKPIGGSPKFFIPICKQTMLTATSPSSRRAASTESQKSS